MTLENVYLWVGWFVCWWTAVVCVALLVAMAASAVAMCASRAWKWLSTPTKVAAYMLWHRKSIDWHRADLVRYDGGDRSEKGCPESRLDREARLKSEPRNDEKGA